MYEYLAEKYENEKHIHEQKYVQDNILLDVTEHFAKKGWELHQILPLEAEGYREYLVILRREK